MKILIGVDYSMFSGDVLQAVIRQFQPANSEVLVLHVVQPIAFEAPPQMGPGYAPELEEEIKPARELVERVAKELSAAGFKVEAVVRVGDVRETIIDFASEWRAELIVLGSHGQRGLKRFLLGSVAEFVARHATCSVQVVRTKVKA